jgi:hypothetical protein
MNQRLPLGAKARDVVTGFTGTITGVARYLTGCDQYVLTAPVGADGEVKAHWYDDNRLVQIGTEVLTLSTAEVRGGPASHPAPLK